MLSWWLCDGCEIQGFSALFSPYDRAERFACSICVGNGVRATERGSTFGSAGMGCVGSCVSLVDDELREGRRGGNDGTGGLSSDD
jgi:hypothetical protein